MIDSFHFSLIVLFNLVLLTSLYFIEKYRIEKYSQPINIIRFWFLIVGIVVFNTVWYLSYFTIFIAESGWNKVRYFGSFVPAFLVLQIYKEVTVQKLQQLLKPTKADEQLLRDYSNQTHRICYLIIILVMFSVSVFLTVTSK
jgi:hypothetical protein